LFLKKKQKLLYCRKTINYFPNAKNVELLGFYPDDSLIFIDRECANTLWGCSAILFS